MNNSRWFWVYGDWDNGWEVARIENFGEKDEELFITEWECGIGRYRVKALGPEIFPPETKEN